VSPFRPSFLHPLVLHPANHRFFTPLFSTSSESLFSQLLCFHIDLRCPIVFSPTSKFSGLFRLRGLCLCGKSIRFIRLQLLPLFLQLAPLFSADCALFCKMPGYGIRRLSRRTHLGVSTFELSGPATFRQYSVCFTLVPSEARISQLECLPNDILPT
jgi:hypothetical protein